MFGFSSKDDKLIKSTRKAASRLTELSMKSRPEADKASVEVAANLALLSVAIDVLNQSGNYTLIDKIVDKLPRSIPDKVINLNSALPNENARLAASKMINGARATNVLGAFEAIYNTRIQEDLKKIDDRQSGPMGRLGGMASVVSEYLFPPEQTPPFIDVLKEVSEYAMTVAKLS